ncbi:MAG: hypothetical protein ACPGWR_28250 [Ardenticatenaceae bacterium]
MITELPKSDELPSVEEMAKLLVKALPASDRSERYTLLVGRGDGLGWGVWRMRWRV